MTKKGIMPAISKAHLTWKRYCQRGLIGKGITLKQFFLLIQLKRKGFLYPADIAEMMYCDRPTASVIIANLEKQGWATRRKDPGNGKRIQIIITKKGQQKLESIEEISKAEAGKAFDPLECFSPEEVEAFGKLLGKLNAHLKNIP